MKNLYKTIKNAKKKRFLFGTKAIFKSGCSISSESIKLIEVKLGLSFPDLVKEFLLELGAGQTEDLYIHGESQIYAFDQDNGPIAGFVTFASDSLGSFFAFNPESTNRGEIFYCCHDPLGYAEVAKDANEFLGKIIDSDYDNLELAANLKLIEYE